MGKEEGGKEAGGGGGKGRGGEWKMKNKKGSKSGGRKECLDWIHWGRLESHKDDCFQ